MEMLTEFLLHRIAKCTSILHRRDSDGLDAVLQDSGIVLNRLYSGRLFAVEIAFLGDPSVPQ